MLDQALDGLNVSGGGASGNTPPNLAVLDGLPADVKEQVQRAAAKAVMWSFVSILPFMGLSILAAVFLGNVWIGMPEKRDESGKVVKEEVRGMVLYGVYLWNLVRVSGCGDSRVRKLC